MGSGQWDRAWMGVRAVVGWRCTSLQQKYLAVRLVRATSQPLPGTACLYGRGGGGWRKAWAVWGAWHEGRSPSGQWRSHAWLQTQVEGLD